jgi:hypothetical protein
MLVASPGILEMKFPNDVKARMLSVRMVVTNNGDDVPWAVDTREQRAIVAGAGESAPAYVNGDADSLPVITVPRGQKRTLELYYPLPANAADAKRVPEFDLIWKVRTGTREVAERVPFERLELQPAYGYGFDPAWGLAPYWWQDPLWPGPMYVIAPPVYYRYARPVRVAPMPILPPSPVGPPVAPPPAPPIGR